MPLSRNKFATIDVADARIVEGYNWSAHRECLVDYAVTTIGGRIVRMHNLITGSAYVDHHDRDGLNNRRKNLRPSTCRQNHGNRTRAGNNTSGFKGVSYDRARDRWEAYINAAHRRKKHLGRFLTAEGAARAYDDAAREIFGEFARVNFPVVGEQGARDAA